MFGPDGFSKRTEEVTVQPSILKTLSAEVCSLQVRGIGGLKYTCQADRSLVNNNHKDS